MKTGPRRLGFQWQPVLLVLAVASTTAAAASGQPGRPRYRSPYDVVVSPDGRRAYVSDSTAANVTVFDLAAGKKTGEIPLRGEPRGLALSADGRRLFVAERLAGTVAVVDTGAGRVVERIAVARWPVAVVLAKRSKRLYVCNQDDDTVSVVDLSRTPPAEVRRVRVVREPARAALSPDEKKLVVVNLLPYGPETDPTLSAVVSVLDTSDFHVSTVKLPPGSTVVQGVCVSPDGRWAYVVHGLGRFNLPVTQLERGWVNTYALTVIDLQRTARLATFLLDELTRGAANPHSVVCSRDGRRLWVTHTGVHEVSTVEVGLVHELLAGKIPQPLAELKDGMRPNIWVRIQQDRRVLSELENDLTALYIAGAIRRFSSGGLGPKGLAVTPDQSRLLVANYYSGQLAVLDAETGQTVARLSLGPQPAPDAVRRGELLFHDARLAFQRWHSCASCHPNQGRVDGLRWDFLRDGIGNPKDTPSLVYVDRTPPLNRRATRKTAKECARTSILAGHLTVPTDQQVDDLYAYLKSLRPEPNPHRRPDGELTEAARRGRALFEGKAHCSGCHPAPYFTDRRMHNVGVLTPLEPDGRYDTPSLVEVWRTAPYLHDGRARTLREVLTKYNPHDKHGHTKELTAEELNDLIEYLKSL